MARRHNNPSEIIFPQKKIIVLTWVIFFCQTMGNYSWYLSQNLSIENKHEFETIARWLSSDDITLVTNFWRVYFGGSTHLHHVYAENPVWILKYAEIFLIVMDSENNWIIVHWLLPPIEIEVRGFMNHNRRSVNNNTSNGQIFFLLFCRPPQNVKPTLEFQFYDPIFLVF